MDASRAARAATAGALILALAGCAAADAAPSAKATVPSACTQGGLTRAVVTTPVSLDQWARVNGDTVSDILGLTFRCGNRARFDAYLDRGSLSAKMRRGTVLYYLLPGGGA
jgi:hypothetical protein